MRSKKTDKIKKTLMTKARARELLFADGNYMTVVFSLIISLPPVFLAYILSAIVSDYTYEWIPFAILALLGFLIGGPILLGTVNTAVAVYRKSKTPLSEVFFAFSSPSVYIRSLLLTLIQLAKLCVELLPAILVASVIDAVATALGINSFFLDTVGIAAAVATVALMKVCTSRLYGLLFFAFDSDELRVMKAIGESWRACKGKTGETMRTRLSFLPLFALSVIPLGIPLLLYTLPYMLCTYVYGMAHISDSEPAPVTEKAVTETEEAPPVTEEINENEEIIENGDINNE